MITSLTRWLLVALFTGLTACSSTPVQQDESRMKRASRYNVDLGVAYMQDGKLDTAMNKLQKAIDQDPGSARAHDAIAVLYGQIDESEEAEQHFRKSLSLDPDNARTHNNYGEFLCRQGEYARAEKEFLAAADDPLYPGRMMALTNAGVCANEIPDPDKAEAYFRRALDEDPYYTRALMYMAQSTLRQGNYLSARGYLQRYEAVAPYSAESLWLGVRIEHGLNDRNASARYALLLKNNFPDSAQAQSLQEWENERRSGR
jgi:type IV pilus assembly protein PilF